MESKFDYIESYFDGRLSKDEREEFDKRRSEDREFDLEVRTYQKANEVIKTAARNRMKTQLNFLGRQQILADDAETANKYRFVRKYWLSMAASVIFISAAAYFAINSILNRTPGTPDKLYLAYFEKPGIDMVTTRGSEADSNSILWNSALELYNKSKYTESAGRINVLLKSPSFDLKSAAFFYGGICYMEMDKADSALIYLNRVSIFSVYADETLWFMGLINIKKGNIPEAIDIMEQIRLSKDHPRQKDASRLIVDLQKLARKRQSE